MNPIRPIRKAVFPVAGLGTRFLPATKAVPKEMLPVIDKPLIQYAVEEAVEAGADTLIFVTRGDKAAIINHFTPNSQLETSLEESGKHSLLECVRTILPRGVRLVTAVQEQPLGLGHAVLCAREHVADEPVFSVLLPDDLVRAPAAGALAQLAAVHASTGASVLAVERIERALSRRYGMAGVEADTDGHLQITSLVEKPAPEDAPSDLGVVGRYILDSRLFVHLEGLGKGAGGEIQLTDGIAALMREHPVYACPLQGQRYDCGSRLGLLKASLDFALDDLELREELLSHLEARRA
jgi:UTP--glucose-1-phosphate uridylyltransferase